MRAAGGGHGLRWEVGERMKVRAAGVSMRMWRRKGALEMSMFGGGLEGGGERVRLDWVWMLMLGVVDLGSVVR